MSTAIYNAKAEGMRAKNTALTNAFAPDGTRCFLLWRAENSKLFESYEAEDGFKSYWNNYREQTEFRFRPAATTDDTFRNNFAKATHIAYGVEQFNDDDESLGFDVFEIQDDQKDKAFPDTSNVYYKAFASRDPRERFENAG